MPALKNPRHEAFAQALARGMSASAAFAGNLHLRGQCRTGPRHSVSPHVDACANCEAVQQILLENMSEFGFVLQNSPSFM